MNNIKVLKIAITKAKLDECYSYERFLYTKRAKKKMAVLIHNLKMELWELTK